MRRPKEHILSTLAGLAVALGILAVGPPRACAQVSAAPSSVQVSVTPYLWVVGIDTAIKTPLLRAPEINSSVDTYEVLENLNGPLLMGSAEISDGPFSLFGDMLHIAVDTDITNPKMSYRDGAASLTTNIGTGLFLYHLLDQPVQALDVGGGFRAWGFSTQATLSAALLPPARVARAAVWADPLLAARYNRDFSNGFGLSVYADFGGFDVGAHVDWQLSGTLNYAPNRWLTLRLGYRALISNYQAPDNVGFNVHMKGPVLAATFRF